MGYERIDDTLKLWANKHNLPLYTSYREEAVRSFQIADSEGRRYQIWIDLPDEKGRIGVHVWDYKKRRKDFVTEQAELFKTLEAAYQTANLWSEGY